MNDTGFEKRGEGGFGCVYKPTELICNPVGVTDPVDPARVLQKALSNDTSPSGYSIARKESKENIAIRNIDENGVFSVRYYGACNIDDKNIKTGKIKESCKPIEGSKNIGILTYEDGGLDIHQYLLSRFNSPDSKIEDITAYWLFINLIDSLLVLIEHVSKLKDKDFAHLDVKSQNIVYNEETGVSKLIDFGLSSKISIVCEKANKWPLQAQWPYESFYIRKYAFDTLRSQLANEQQLDVYKQAGIRVGIYDLLLDKYEKYKTQLPLNEMTKQIAIIQKTDNKVNDEFADENYYNDAIPSEDPNHKNKRMFAYKRYYPDFYYFNLLNYNFFGNLYLNNNSVETQNGFKKYIENQKQSFIDMMKRTYSQPQPYETFVRKVIEQVDTYCMGQVFADVLSVACERLPNAMLFKIIFIQLYFDIMTSDLYKRDVGNFINTIRRLITEERYAYTQAQTQTETEAQPEMKTREKAKTPVRRERAKAKTERYSRRAEVESHANIPPPTPPPRGFGGRRRTIRHKKNNSKTKKNKDKRK